MPAESSTASRHVVLAGGGHAHALLLREWGMKPDPGISLTLVSPAPQTPYSGMLPGLIAGHYSQKDIYIDLEHLCQWGNVRFIQAKVCGLSPDQKQVLLSDRSHLTYDVLSLDTGSTPSLDVPGVLDHAIPIKPIAGFWQRWQSLLGELHDSDQSRCISVVGGGAGALESILAMAWATRRDCELKAAPIFQLVFNTQHLLPGYPQRVRRAALKACRDLGVSLHNNFPVREVGVDFLAGDQGIRLATDYVFWCTQAGAPAWPADSGLACNESGFIKVNQFLQSTSHPAIFAAGDNAHMVHTPRPKAGVYAVRQAPTLLANIRRYLYGQPLTVFTPQDRFLSLLALGDKKAVGSKGGLSVSGRWVWRWKNRIDQAFMQQFRSLPEAKL